MTRKAAGIYCWAGPGTIRMVKLKYPNLTIDEPSLMASYDYPNLKAAKQKLGLTDTWVSYSWGFSEETEKEDYAFLRSKLDNFKKLKIKTHAYIQGPNLVKSEHLDEDYWARDHRGRLIPYHRGRYMTCLNNPKARAYIEHKVALALKEEVDGVFVDNFYFGLFPLIVGESKVSFFGCRCKHCLKKFKKEYGGLIPTWFEKDSALFKDYLSFRSKTVFDFSKKLSKQIHAKDKLYGCNSMDPKLDTVLYYGTDLDNLDSVQDYFLFENHDLPSKNKSNVHLEKRIKSLKSPVFIVSYKQGIGREKLYTQKDFEAIYTESKRLGYHPCYKASEYSFNGREENFDFHTIKKVTSRSGLKLARRAYSAYKPLGKEWMLPIINFGYVPFMQAYYNNPIMRKMFNGIYYKALE